MTSHAPSSTVTHNIYLVLWRASHEAMEKLPSLKHRNEIVVKITHNMYFDLEITSSF